MPDFDPLPTYLEFLELKEKTLNEATHDFAHCEVIKKEILSLDGQNYGEEDLLDELRYQDFMAAAMYIERVAIVVRLQTGSELRDVEILLRGPEEMPLDPLDNLGLAILEELQMIRRHLRQEKKCPVCKEWFIPDAFNMMTCSTECQRKLEDLPD